MRVELLKFGIDSGPMTFFDWVWADETPDDENRSLYEGINKKGEGYEMFRSEFWLVGSTLLLAYP
jgi:hypothetical protein